jgi:hypothetical protein
LGRKIIFNVQIHKIDDNILEYSCTLPSIVITECCDLPVCNTCHHLKHDHHCHFCQGNLTNVVHLTERKDLEKNLNQKLMVNFYYFFINPPDFQDVRRFCSMFWMQTRKNQSFFKSLICDEM